MNIKSFVVQNGLRPADAIVLRKKFMGMFSHFAIYLGDDDFGNPKFSANFTKGVKLLPNREINEQIKVYKPERIERFKGNNYQRTSAIERACSRIGENAYDFLSNNCEHYKNWVHYGKEISDQVDNVGAGSLAIGTTMAIGGLLSENSRVRNQGIGLLLFGALLKGLAKRN